MKELRYVIFFIASIVSLASCGVSTHYVGKSYAPTSTVDIYMEWRDIPVDYEVMGYAEGTPDGLSTVENAQIKLEELARMKGADAIVFEGIETRYSNPVLETTEKTEKNIDGGYTKKITTEEKIQQTATLKVTFIKFKK